MEPAAKEPLPEGSGISKLVPQNGRKINMVSTNGVDYHLPPGLLDEAFVHNLTNMEGDEFVKKYSLVPWGAVDGPNGPQEKEKLEGKQQHK